MRIMNMNTLMKSIAVAGIAGAIVLSATDASAWGWGNNGYNGYNNYYALRGYAPVAPVAPKAPKAPKAETK